MSVSNTIEHKTLLGTVSGTLLTVVMNIETSDILKTIVLAALGAVVSFGVTVGLKRIWPLPDFLKKKRKKEK
jgi:hypothetical protein